MTNCNLVCVFCGCVCKVWVFVHPRLRFGCWCCLFYVGLRLWLTCACLIEYICSGSTIQVQDKTLDFDEMVKNLVLSPTRRVLVASLTMFSCLCSSRYMSGPHGSAFVFYLFDWLYVRKFITIAKYVRDGKIVRLS